MDTPGHADFKIEVERCLNVLDSVVIVFCSVAGVQSQTETVYREANKMNLPKIIFINKIDRKGSRFYEVVEEICNKLSGCNPVVLFLPIIKLVNADKHFIGLLDILNYRKIIFKKGIEYEIQDSFTEEEQNNVDFYRSLLFESLKEYYPNITDDITTEELIEKISILVKQK